MLDVKIGICQWSLPVDGPYGCKLAAELGFDGIQLDMGNHRRGYQLSRKVVQEAFLEAKELYKLDFPSIAITDFDYVSMTYPKDNQEKRVVREAVFKAIQTAEAMGIPMVMIPNFEASAIKDENGFQNVVEVLKFACDKAKDVGITISTENLLSIDETVRLFEETDRTNLKVFLDSQNHFLHKGYDIPQMIKSLYPLLINQFHFKDGKKGELSGSLLGEGDTDFFKTIRTLHELDFSGWLICENFYDQEPLSLKNIDPIVLMKQDLAILEKAVKDSNEQ